MKTKLLLASASPRRHDLLNQIGVDHEILNVPSPPGEDEPRLAHESPLQYVQRTALDKAIRAQNWWERNQANEQANEQADTQVGLQTKTQIAILSADTTVALGDLVLGKPKDAEDASQILRALSGKTHIVYTALVLSQFNTGTMEQQNRVSNNEVEGWSQWNALSMTHVQFCQLSEQDITEYIKTGEPFGKAGAYGIQGYAARFIERIDGSYSGVMGLPLFETAELLTKI